MKRQAKTIIAGPCSVENYEQLSQLVRALTKMGSVDKIRCGVWKPRTRPGGFEGMGEPALKWMAALRKEMQEEGESPLPYCCEVAQAAHVEMALRYGVDEVWIGARSTGNPFSVREITEALRGTGMPVMVKNAPTPDVRIWMGAIERCHQAGLTEVTAVHRGYEMYNNHGYRNNPLWEVPMELRRQMPEIALICDPSHIAGRRELLKQLSQTALDLNFDGLMIETHPNPAEALTDAEQQITPDELRLLIEQLQCRRETGTKIADALTGLRKEIDAIDQQLLQLLSERMEVSKQIAKVKEQNNLSIYQAKRWDEVLQSRKKAASEKGLDEEFVQGLFEKIHAESVRVQIGEEKKQ